MMIVTSSRLNGMEKPDGDWCRCCSRRSGRSQHHDDLQTKRYHYDCNLQSSMMMMTTMMIVHGYYLLATFFFQGEEQDKSTPPIRWSWLLCVVYPHCAVYQHWSASLLHCFLVFFLKALHHVLVNCTIEDTIHTHCRWCTRGIKFCDSKTFATHASYRPCMYL